MGFRYNKRIKLGKGFGVNVSKSGIRPSVRTKKGSLSSKGYSLRTGIPGLTYRKTFSKSKNSGCMFAVLLPILLLFLVIWSYEGDECSSKTNCSDFSSQSSASSDYDLCQECRDNLDQDNDVIALEELAN